ncbi:helix-turn-helix transcriptional regulator [Flagellimonas aequoris]|uniref:AraC family transcriptional regulator n=1 Tax=Flagellimonas aequoris TaxID=2306997 RepID=A0A418N860_9FLAO|nr:helix-turn-helix transcriptional regulator [Allomuricauda aequoris]RIV71334.1 AraC family transcriptional regulator [Allomuricauda aequoris]TXK02803.1 helix-turn-helix transcriptional regulator [Allomuricauda aequoris]
MAQRIGIHIFEELFQHSFHMKETFNLVSLLDTLGLVQGVLLGIMLILIHSRKRKAVLYLGLFIILFSLEPLENIFHELGVLQKWPHLILLPVSFHFLAYPLFYIYLQKISILEDERPSYWTMVPGFLELIVGVVVFFLPLHIKTWIKDSNAMLIYFLLGMGYSLFIQILALKWIVRHRTELENQYSLLLHRNLKWSTYFIYASIVFSMLFLLTFLTDDRSVYIVYSAVNVVLIYWISYQGFAQQNISPVYHSVLNVPSGAKNESAKNEDKIIKENPADKKVVKTPDEQEIFRQVLDRIQDHMVKSRCFTKEDLTIVDVSEAIHEHPRRISQSINSLLGTNFNNYINSFRVEYAKELFSSDQYKNLSIEGIGMEAGFHSKSTFYAAFKKIEGTTPAKLRPE